MAGIEALAGIALGSALGGILRYFVSGRVAHAIGETFPWGTMIVNGTGSLAIGVIAAIADGGGVTDGGVGWEMASVGFLGSYTTVSSFSLQTLALVRDGEILRACGNVVLSLFLGLLAVALGYGACTALAGGLWP
jgi:CrcB protein